MMDISNQKDQEKPLRLPKKESMDQFKDDSDFENDEKSLKNKDNAEEGKPPIKISMPSEQGPFVTLNEFVKHQV